MGWNAVTTANGDQPMGYPPHEQTQTSGNAQVHTGSDLPLPSLYGMFQME